MRSTSNKIPFFAAICMALLFATFPGEVQAQATGPGFNASTCVQNQMNAYTDRAQASTAARAKIFSNANNPGMRKVYCWETIQSIFSTIGTITSDASIFGALIWTLVLQAIQSLINQVCSAVVGAITSAINMVKSLLCIPLPHFSLNMGFNLNGSSSFFGGGACPGISLLSLGSSSAAGTRPPNRYSPLWNYTPPQ